MTHQSPDVEEVFASEEVDQEHIGESKDGRSNRQTPEIRQRREHIAIKTPEDSSRHGTHQREGEKLSQLLPQWKINEASGIVAVDEEVNHLSDHSTPQESIDTEEHTDEGCGNSYESTDKLQPKMQVAS